jgi:hypothetical protein
MPILTRSLSIEPSFELEFDFDSLVSPVQCVDISSNIHANERSNNRCQWKDEFLNDLHRAKKRSTSLTPTNSTTIISSSTVESVDSKTHEDTLWNFMKESNPELFEKFERTHVEQVKRSEPFNTKQFELSHRTSTSNLDTSGKVNKCKNMIRDRERKKSLSCPLFISN